MLALSNQVVPYNRIIVGLLSITLIFAAGCNSKRLKTIGAIVAVGVAAKIIYDMVVEHRSKQVGSEKEVANRYQKSFGKLPDEPVLLSYESSIQPGGVVKAGDNISIVSKLEVVRGANSRKVDIQEKITIFDNEDNTKELKNFTKPVNQETNNSGAFENEFTFTLPKGMPQGVYPVQTTVIVDGKAYEPVNNQMQLVYTHKRQSSFQLIATN